MSELITKAIEAATSQMTEQAGQSHGTPLSVAELLVSTQSDFIVSLGYAALFFPVLTISNGIPIAKFATSVSEQPLDCFHIDLLHHTAASGRAPEIYAAVGQALAEAWTYALIRQNLSGRFSYDSSNGFDVVYEP
jgi:hypothetical protein